MSNDQLSNDQFTKLFNYIQEMRAEMVSSSGSMMSEINQIKDILDRMRHLRTRSGDPAKS